MMHVLICGGSGQLGEALRRTSWSGNVVLHAPRRDELDLANVAEVERHLTDNQINAVINAAAYTAVDRAEGEVVQAMTGNAMIPAVLATASAGLNIPIVHISTDYVFDGRLGRPYSESDPTSPVGLYATTKLAGERACGAANPRAVILRTAWIISPYRTNFLKTMLRLATERDAVRVVADQKGCPTSADDLAGAIRTITERLVVDDQAPIGAYHVANQGEATWAELAQEIFACSQRSGGPAASVEPIKTEDYPTAAVRPQDSRLDTSKLERDYGLRLRPWRDAVSSIITELQGEAGT